MQDFQIVWVPEHNSSTETWIAISDGKTIGHISMLIETGKRLKFRDAWVDPDWRRKGIFRSLWETRWNSVSERYPEWTVYAWCKATSLPLLLEKGFDSGEVSTYVEKRIESPENNPN